MRAKLIPHPATLARAVESIEVDVARPALGRLVLEYRLRGDPQGLRIAPPRADPRRRGELWRTTCFEAFARTDGDAYAEFNLAPSGEWDAYRFASYRAGMSRLDLAAPPRIEVERLGDGLRLLVHLEFPAPGLADAAPLGLCAVIEDQAGIKSYWALAHPPGQADFHHPDCFAAQLPPPGQP
jgi:hypothetical protein